MQEQKNTLSNLKKRELELLRVKKKRACEASFYAFFVYFWSIVCKEKFIDNFHIKYLCDLFQDVAERAAARKHCLFEYYLINVPPGSTKSLIFSVLGPVWCWIHDDTLRLITGTYERALATDFNVQSRLVLKSPEFTALWGDKVIFRGDDDGKTQYSNTNGGSRKIATVGSSAVGKHAHIINLDDILNPQEIASEPAKLAAINWIRGTLSMRKVDKLITPTFIVSQRLAEDDPPGFVLDEMDSVFHVCLPGEITNATTVKPQNLEKYYKNGLFDPVRLPRKALRNATKALGDKGYSNQILQLPAAAEGTIWKREWWGEYDSFPQTRCLRSIHSWDTDFGKKSASNGGVFAKEYETGLYIIGIFDESLQFPQLEEIVDEYHISNPCTHCLIEDKASGQSLLQVKQQKTKIPVVAIEPFGDKVTRAYASTTLVKNRKVFLPKNESWVKAFIDMMAGFPDIKKKDVADAFSQLINWIILNPIGHFSASTVKIDVDEIIRRKARKNNLSSFRNVSHRS